jgi:hypothetical protein
MAFGDCIVTINRYLELQITMDVMFGLLEFLVAQE